MPRIHQMQLIKYLSAGMCSASVMRTKSSVRHPLPSIVASMSQRGTKATVPRHHKRARSSSASMHGFCSVLGLSMCLVLHTEDIFAGLAHCEAENSAKTANEEVDSTETGNSSKKRAATTVTRSRSGRQAQKDDNSPQARLARSMSFKSSRRLTNRPINGQGFENGNRGAFIRRQDTSKSNRFVVSASSDRGSRPYMEDTHFVSPNKRYVGVHDGHGGAHVAELLRARLYTSINNQLLFMMREGQTWDVRKALATAFAETDQEISFRRGLDQVGSTVVSVLLEDDNIWTVNVGDSRAILCRKGEAVQITRDHKPNDEMEKTRIESLGGKVQWFGWTDPEGNPQAGFGAWRVNGNLAVARAMGDKDQRPFVSSEPEIMKYERDFEEDQYIVVATDGLWDVIINQEVVDFVRDVMTGGIGARGSWRKATHDENSVSLKEWRAKYAEDSEMLKAALSRRKVMMASYIVEEALQRGSSDNITVVILWLQ